jgi:hypothetical protein
VAALVTAAESFQQQKIIFHVRIGETVRRIFPIKVVAGLPDVLFSSPKS